MGPQYLSGVAESDATAIGLGREKWNKNFILDFRRYAASIVTDSDLSRMPDKWLAGNFNKRMGDIFHRMHTVFYQVYNHLHH